MCRTGSRTFQMVKYKIQCCTVHISTFFSPPPFLRWVIPPLPSKGAVIISTPPSSSLFAASGRSQHWREITGPLLTKQEQRNVALAIFPAWNPFRTPASSIRYALPSVLWTSSWGEGAAGAALRFPSYYPPRATALVQACNSIVKNAGLAVPTGRDAIEGSNVVHHAPLEGGPFCQISFGYTPRDIVRRRPHVPDHLRCYLGFHGMLPWPILHPVFFKL